MLGPNFNQDPDSRLAVNEVFHVFVSKLLVAKVYWKSCYLPAETIQPMPDPTARHMGQDL